MEKAKLPSLVTVLILTLITVVMWVGFDVYRLFNQPAAPSVPVSVSNPITPSLDQDAINQLESRPLVDNSQIPDNVVNASANSAPQSSSETQTIPTNSPIPTPTTASGSGTSI